MSRVKIMFLLGLASFSFAACDEGVSIPEDIERVDSKVAAEPLGLNEDPSSSELLRPALLNGEPLLDENGELIYISLDTEVTWAWGCLDTCPCGSGSGSACICDRCIGTCRCAPPPIKAPGT